MKNEASESYEALRCPICRHNRNSKEHRKRNCAKKIAAIHQAKKSTALLAESP
jgi:ssDNA-binding Zn-finger/Zn-ribbon topoisomerase 1